MEFQEKTKVQIALFSTGATTEQTTKYYPMAGYRRVDFLVSGLVQLSASGAAGATSIQQFTCRVLQASDSSGGGSSALSSATALVGKDSATGISTSMKLREGIISFSTLTSAVPVEISIAGVTYTGATAAAANKFACASAAAAATVASEGFKTMFNSTANNTSTAVTEKWQAATMAGAFIRIIPKDPDGTDLLSLGTTGGTQIGVGGVFQAQIGVEAQFLGDGKTHVALGVKSTLNANPFTVHVIRERAQGPAAPVTYMKTLGQSTSK